MGLVGSLIKGEKKMSAVLNLRRVSETFEACRQGSGVEVVVNDLTIVNFRSESLEAHRSTIEEMLAELPPEFNQSAGGWSLIKAVFDKNGDLWTGLQSGAAQLLILGIAIGKVQNVLPRELWPVLPGGMPYYMILDT